MDEAAMGIGLGVLLSTLAPTERAEELYRRLMAREDAVIGLPPSLERRRPARERQGKRKKRKKVCWLRTYIPGQTLQKRPSEPEKPREVVGPLSSGKPTSDPVLKKIKKPPRPPNSTKRPHKPLGLEKRPHKPLDLEQRSQKPPDPERKPLKPAEPTKKLPMPPEVVRKRPKGSESARRLQKPPELERRPQKSKPKVPMPDVAPKRAARKPKGEVRLPSLPNRKPRRERPAESRIKLPKLKNYFHDLVLQGDFERTYHNAELNHLRDLLLDESPKSPADPPPHQDEALYSFNAPPSFLPDLEPKKSEEEDEKASYKMQLADLINFFANRSPGTVVVTDSPDPPRRTAKDRDRQWRSIKLPKLRHIMPEAPPPPLIREKPKPLAPAPTEAPSLREREREFYGAKLARLEETIADLPEVKPTKSEKKRYKLLIDGLDRLSSPYVTRGPAIDLLTELSESLDQHAAPVDIGTFAADGTAARLAPWRHKPASPEPPTPPPQAAGRKKRRRKRTSKSVASNGSEISVKRRRSGAEVREERKIKAASDAVDVVRKAKVPIDDGTPDDSLARAYQEVIAHEKKLKAARLKAETLMAPPKKAVAPAARRKPTLPSVSLTVGGKMPAPRKTTRGSASFRLPTVPKDAAKTGGIGDEKRSRKVDDGAEKRRKPPRVPDAQKMPPRVPDAKKMPPATNKNSTAKSKKVKTAMKIAEPVEESWVSVEEPPIRAEDSACWDSKPAPGPESSQFFLKTLMEFSQPEPEQ